MTANPPAQVPTRPRWERRLQSLGVALLCLAAPACVYATSDSRVFLTSDPPGADVAVDGKATGLTTPTILELGETNLRDHQVTVSKEGFDQETRSVIHHKIFYTSAWEDAVIDPGVMRFPLWFTFGDFFAPFGVRWQFEPHELHVKLYKKGEFVESPPAAEEPKRPESR